MKISLFIPCFVDQLFPKVGMSTVQVLERLGHEVHFPSGQTCCGQPALNSGYWDEAKEVASRFLDIFEDAEVIVCPSGSCTTMVRQFYSELFHPPSQGATVSGHEGMRVSSEALAKEDCHRLHHTSSAQAAANIASKTFEFTEFLVCKLGITDVGAQFHGKVAWHDACHGLRELHLKEEPRKLLRAVRNLELIEMKECETCCGFGGTFSIKFPNISVAMDEVKVRSAEECGAEYVASGDSSCLMQINGLIEKRRSKLKTIHIAEILASKD